MNLSREEQRALLSLKQPDSLKLTAKLAILKWFHSIATQIEDRFGDKSAEKKLFLPGVQGVVSRPSWNRDYSYLLACVGQVRDHLTRHLVGESIESLARTALEIYNRFDNRRRMGVEVIVLAMLVTKYSTWFEVPDKYHSVVFVLEMLVSCRHRFQKPEKAYFWSRQSQELLGSVFQLTSRHLTRLKLAIANDALLKGVAIHCNNLTDLEVQFAQDVTEEALFALAGKSVARRDQGLPRTWPHSHNLNSDFSETKEWFVKDSLLFTPPPSNSPPRPSDKDPLPRCFDTGFGVKKLVKFRVHGDFIFPPLARKFKECSGNHFSLNNGKQTKGPILEFGFYMMLTSLKSLTRVTMNGLPMVVAKLGARLTQESRAPCPLSMTSLTMDRELLGNDDLDALARMVGDSITEISNVSPECSADFFYDACLSYLDGISATTNMASGSPMYQGQDRHQSNGVCGFLTRLTKLRSFHGRISMACLANFARLQGSHLTRLQLTANVLQLSDLVLLRKYAKNLVTVQGRLVVSETAASQNPLSLAVSPAHHLHHLHGHAHHHHGHHHHHHHHHHIEHQGQALAAAQVHAAIPVEIGAPPRAKKRHQNHIKLHRRELARDVEEVFRSANYKDLSSPFSQGLVDLLAKFPLEKLTKVDLEGRISLSAFQIMAGNAPNLEELHLTNSPLSSTNSGDTKALSDEWLEALIAVNPLKCIKRVTLRLDNDQTVESGSFSERGLVKFLTHCQDHSPKLTDLVGEFTRVPDKILEEKTVAFVKAGLRRLRVRNAVPYRRFENAYETERHYSMNPGYHAMLAEHVHQQHQHHHQHHLAANAVEGGVHDLQGGQEQGGQDQTSSSGGGARGRRRFQGYVFRPYPKPRHLDEDGSVIDLGSDE